MNKFSTVFLAYHPQLKPQGGFQGGGFQLTLDIPETEWQQIKELNDPQLNSYEFVVKLKGTKKI
jgi:hypothetical protein